MRPTERRGDGLNYIRSRIYGACSWVVRSSFQFFASKEEVLDDDGFAADTDFQSLLDRCLFLSEQMLIGGNITGVLQGRFLVKEQEMAAEAMDLIMFWRAKPVCIL